MQNSSRSSASDPAPDAAQELDLPMATPSDVAPQPLARGNFFSSPFVKFFTHRSEPPLPERRGFLKGIGVLAAAGSGTLATRSAQANGHSAGPDDPMGVLVDLSMCVGCRLCEHACKGANGVEPGPVESYDDTSVFKDKRRPSPTQRTVVNSWSTDLGTPVYAKVNCMHCNHASCVSACIVGAMEKQPNGAVTYDAWKCIGCRYCMVACPFQIPTYEYDNVLTPQVRKCELCHHRTFEGKLPACVEACPRQVMTYGKRSELIAVAHERIGKNPGQYINHLYGEHEVGGTSWMYLSPVQFEQAGFLTLGNAAPPALTEAIQHGVFKYGIAPIGWYSFLAFMAWKTGRKTHGHHAENGEPLPPSPGTPGEGWGEGDVSDGDGDPMPSGSLRRSLSPNTGQGDTGGVALLDPPKPHAKLHEHHDGAAPANVSLNTPGVWILATLVVVGVGFALYRFIFGLAAATNLNQQYPWGLWIAMDVGSGIALAGGGFVTAALVHIFHREHYHIVARSALLTALLGYTFYVPGLLADIGRWYNIWHPTLPNMWQGNSVLFEVGICVMLYLNVQYLELAPIICERFLGGKGRISSWATWLHHNLERVMPALLIGGVALSTFHQSSLGNLMVIAPYKLHALWWSPISPIFFLLSAMMVGFPMVIFTMLTACWALKRKPRIDVLGPLSLYAVVFLAIYLVLKIGDVIWRGVYVELATLSPQSISWIAEVLIGVVEPLVLLCIPQVRRSPGLLAASCFAVIFGVILNRLNVFVIGYAPPFSQGRYFPSVTEFAVSIGLVAALMLVYRVAVTYLPILPAERKEAR